MTAKHTPGEWKERIDNPIFNKNPIPMPEYVIYGEGGKRLIASVWTKTKLGDKEAEANARLIAAAPEMLGNLEWANAILDGYEPPIDREPLVKYLQGLRTLRAAIRKARGA